MNDPHLELINGDCLIIMDEMIKKGIKVQSIICDPPYELGFMNRKWDSSGISFNPETWKRCYDLLPPGGHLLVFGGSRTFHRIACAIEDAGFDIKDTIMYIFASGFPKGNNISKGIDRKLGAEPNIVGRRKHPTLKDANKIEEKVSAAHGSNVWEREWDLTDPVTEEAKQWKGWNSALKPAYEPIILARKPLDGTLVENIMKYGVGGINIDACRIETPDGQPAYSYPNGPGGIWSHDYQQINSIAKDWNNTSTIKDNEPSEGNSKGRWPANLIFDEDAAKELDEKYGKQPNGEVKPMFHDKKQNVVYEGGFKYANMNHFKYASDGGASRYFFTTKANRTERDAGLNRNSETVIDHYRQDPTNNPYLRGKVQRKNIHPTVKPVDLMRWLVKLVTPPGGICLDSFMGSGSTGIAARCEGFGFIGIEKEEEYFKIAEARIDAWRLHLDPDVKPEKQNVAQGELF